jgi:hypothetical protein
MAKISFLAVKSHYTPASIEEMYTSCSLYVNGYLSESPHSKFMFQKVNLIKSIGRRWKPDLQMDLDNQLIKKSELETDQLY